MDTTLYEQHLERRLNQVAAALDRMAEDCVAIEQSKGEARWRAVGALIYQVWEVRAMLGLKKVAKLDPM